MRALSASDLLAAWERGAGSTPVGQALAILSVAFPHLAEAELLKLNVAQRDLYLLYLRSLTFGPHLKGLTACQSCGERLELDLNTDDLTSSTSLLPDIETMIVHPDETVFQWKDYELVYRLPNSMDLNILNARINPGAGHHQLLEACILSSHHQDHEIAASALPAEMITALVEHMSQVASVSDLTMTVHCPTCGNAWDILFDIGSFFWGEINTWAARLVREVHILAMAYGWREADILAMSAWRRQQYLGLIGVR